MLSNRPGLPHFTERPGTPGCPLLPSSVLAPAARLRGLRPSWLSPKVFRAEVLAGLVVGPALVGLMESVMTAKLVDDITDTRSGKTRESVGQGIADITAPAGPATSPRTSCAGG
ncbi:hypothetical protein ACIA74_32770 [Streptomyces sp. NPDC051658]|uniref:hypothetical protein n=1 Tax=Streptomyces sp. NPDC051658 TaxID=3365667 RepID=UPI00379533B8